MQNTEVSSHTFPSIIVFAHLTDQQAFMVNMWSEYLGVHTCNLLTSAIFYYIHTVTANVKHLFLVPRMRGLKKSQAVTTGFIFIF